MDTYKLVETVQQLPFDDLTSQVVAEGLSVKAAKRMRKRKIEDLKGKMGEPRNDYREEFYAEITFGEPYFRVYGLSVIKE